MTSIVFMFSGQGAQYYQMGAELYANDNVYRAAFDRCAEIVMRRHQHDLLKNVFGNSMAESEHYDDLEQTNIALLAQGYATAQSLLGRGIQPAALVGYSLGELIAAVVADVIGLEDALSLAQAQAQHMLQRAPMATMVAILASPTLVLENPRLAELAEIGCINSPVHFVMGVALANVTAFTDELDRLNVNWARLPVQQGFHTTLIDPAEFGYDQLANTLTFKTPTWPLYSSLLAARIEEVTSAHFWRVARGLVRFRDVMTNLWAAQPRLFIDCGPTGTLAAFVKQQFGQSVTALPAMNQFGRNLETMQRLEQAIAEANRP